MRGPTGDTIYVKTQSPAKNGTHIKCLHEALDQKLVFEISSLHNCGCRKLHLCCQYNVESSFKISAPFKTTLHYFIVNTKAITNLVQISKHGCIFPKTTLSRPLYTNCNISYFLLQKESFYIFFMKQDGRKPSSAAALLQRRK